MVLGTFMFICKSFRIGARRFLSPWVVSSKSRSNVNRRVPLKKMQFARVVCTAACLHARNFLRIRSIARTDGTDRSADIPAHSVCAAL